MHITVLFFATIKERVGKNTCELEVQEDTKVRDLKDILGSEFPGISDMLSSVLVSINRTYAFDDDIVPDKAEIAIFPPVSGGSSRFTKPNRTGNR